MRHWLLTAIWLLSAVAAPDRAFSQQANFKPILPIGRASLRTIPLLDVVLRDPKVDLKIKDRDEAEDALEDGKEAEEDYAKAEPAEKQRYALEALRFYAALSYYLEDIDIGAAKGGLPLKLRDMRAKVMEVAKIVMENANEPAVKERARFHYYAQAYLRGKENQVAAVFAKKPAATIDGAYAERLELLAALGALGEADPSQGLVKITKVSEELDGYGPFVTGLASARALAGFDLRGKKVREAKPTYNTYLYKAALLSEDFNRELKDIVLSYVINIWVQAEGEKTNWDKPPFAAQNFQKFAQLDAINERRAYKLFETGKYEEALEIFAKLLAEYEDSEELGRLTERHLAMLAIAVQKTGNDEPYVQALYRADKHFRAAGVMGADEKAAAKKFSKKFHNLFHIYVLRALKAATSPNARVEARSSAVKGGTMFLTLSDDKKEKTRILNEIAQVHTLNQEHAKAVETYLDVAKLNKVPQKNVFIGKAIESQRILAQWPQTPPWDKALPGDEDARKKLIYLYKMTGKKGETSWDALAHIGLLYRANGDLGQAFKLWLPRLSSGASDGNAQRAAGMMLSHHYAQKDWKDVVEICQVARKHKMAPLHQGKAVDVDAYLADGLYFSGEEAFKKRDYKLAVASFQGFKGLFGNDKRLPEAIYKSGLAYVELHDDKKFAGMMRTIISRYPSSPFAKDAIKKGIDLSKDESDKIYFLEASIKQYPNDPNVGTLRDMLAKLYMNVLMYEKAVVVYQDMEKDKNAKPAQKVIANVRIIEMVEKSKKTDAALAAADRLIKMPRVSSGALAKAYAFKAKNYARQKQFNKVTETSVAAEKITSRDEETAAALAEIRLLMVVLNGPKLPAAPDPKVITDANKEMQNQAAGFLAYKTQIDKVCELGDKTDACKVARQDLSKVAQQSFDNVQSINLVQASEEKAFKDFETLKKKILEAISASIIKAH